MKNLPLVANKRGICSRNINIHAIWVWAENTVNSGVLLHLYHQTHRWFGEPPVPTDMCFMYTCISHTPCTLLHISLLLSELIHLLVIFLGERRHVISRPTHLFFSRLRAWSTCFSNSMLPRGFESFCFFFEKIFEPETSWVVVWGYIVVVFAQKKTDNNSAHCYQPKMKIGI